MYIIYAVIDRSTCTRVTLRERRDASQIRDFILALYSPWSDQTQNITAPTIMQQLLAYFFAQHTRSDLCQVMESSVIKDLLFAWIEFLRRT